LQECKVQTRNGEQPLYKKKIAFGMLKGNGNKWSVKLHPRQSEESSWCGDSWCVNVLDFRFCQSRNVHLFHKDSSYLQSFKVCSYCLHFLHSRFSFFLLSNVQIYI